MRHTGVTEPVAGRVREEIAKLGISKREVARKTGISPSALYNKLAGRTDFKLPELHRIALTLRIPTSTLIPDDLDEEDVA